MKNKTHIIILIDAEKVFDKTRHPFMIKTVLNVVMQGTYLNLLMDIYDKFTANILNGEKNEGISSKKRNKTR